MKILIINNYSMKKTMKWAKMGTLPFHHVWGIDELEKHYKLRFLNYHCPTYLVKWHLAKLYYYAFQLLSLVFSYRCQYVYAAASPYINLLASLYYRGWLKKRIYMIVHHPDNFSLHKKAYSKLIFISKIAYEKACKDYPDQTAMFVYNEWGPDIAFYDHAIREKVKEKTPNYSVTFMSNGKSNRDHDCLVKAARGLTKCNVVIICTKNSAPAKYDKCIDRNVQIRSQSVETILNTKMMSYTEMVRTMEKIDVVVIPVPKGYKALCGLTSFNDAIALGKPVIIANTSNLGIDIEKKKLGFIYRGGDVEDLRAKMMKFIEKPALIEEYGRNSRLYAQANDNNAFSRNLLEIIES